SVRAVNIGRYRLVKFPRTRFMPIGAIEQGSGRANLDAVSAFRTAQPSAVCSDHGIDAAVSGFDRVCAHPFLTDARTAFAQNAALRVVRDDRRKIFFGLCVL